MSFFRHNWFYIGMAIFIVLAMVTGIFYEQIGQLRVLLILNFMAMLAHQFEEYGIPGGFGAVSNVFVAKEREIPDRFPFNANQTLFTNVSAWVYYLVAIIFAQVSWLALIVIFGIVLQFYQHFFFVPRKLGRLYNPGFATTILTLLPAAAAYLNYAIEHDMITKNDVFYGVIGAVVFIVGCVVLPIRLMHSRDSQYPYTADEMNKPYVLWLTKQLKDK
ncbi:HXXEE domain-containing protein [Pasteurellaceae bacterium LIM206]|nr:HXXEE domain-containing protein [Pasteurellaceae bacterium LIM206]